MARIYTSIDQLVGNTPLLELKNIEKQLSARKQALSAIENRLVTQTEDQDLQDLIEAFDFDLLFYQRSRTKPSFLSYRMFE